MILFSTCKNKKTSILKPSIFLGLLSNSSSNDNSIEDSKGSSEGDSKGSSEGDSKGSSGGDSGDNSGDDSRNQYEISKLFTGLSSHNFILTTDNRLLGFGSNYLSQLGLGDTAAQKITTPTEITDRNVRGKVQEVFIGASHSFILSQDERLFAFGNNVSGQLGLGDAIKKATTPIQITDINIKSKVKNVFSGSHHTFVLTTDNKLFAFGDNSEGQLGLGGAAASKIKTPVEITDVNIRNKVKNIVVGSNHTFVLTTDNKLFTFGDNSEGQLGLGGAAASKIKTPVEVTDVNIKDKVADIMVGSNHTFVLTTDNKLFAFGNNSNGQLGLGDAAASKIKTPTEITDVNVQGKVNKIFSSGENTLLLTTDKRLFSFGNNMSGQLGLGDTGGNPRKVPTEITDINIKGKVQQVFIGSFYAFVSTTNEKVFAFGWNNSGQLGLGPKAAKDFQSPTLTHFVFP